MVNNGQPSGWLISVKVSNIHEDYSVIESEGLSFPQLRHEPITYSFCLPHFRQFWAFEVIIMLSFY
jgi:hypothetical protein